MSANKWCTPRLFPCIVDWLILVTRKHDLHNNHVIFLASRYAYEYTLKVAYDKKKLEIVIMVCFWIACKVELDGTFSLYEIVEWYPRIGSISSRWNAQYDSTGVSNTRVLIDEMTRLEGDVLRVLDWRTMNDSVFVHLGYACTNDVILANEVALISMYALPPMFDLVTPEMCLDVVRDALPSDAMLRSKLKEAASNAMQLQAHTTYPWKVLSLIEKL